MSNLFEQFSPRSGRICVRFFIYTVNLRGNFRMTQKVHREVNKNSSLPSRNFFAMHAVNDNEKHFCDELWICWWFFWWIAPLTFNLSVNRSRVHTKLELTGRSSFTILIESRKKISIILCFKRQKQIFVCMKNERNGKGKRHFTIRITKQQNNFLKLLGESFENFSASFWCTFFIVQRIKMPSD